MSRRSVSHHSASGRSSHPREQTTKTRTANQPDLIAASHSGSRAGSQAGSRAGPPAGSVAGSRAGSVAGSVAGSKAASRAGSQVGSKAGSQYSHARSSTAVSEADYGYAASGSLYRPPYTTIGKWAANSYSPPPSVASGASSHYTNASMQRSDTSSSQHRAWNTWGRKYCYENGRQVSEFPQSSSGRSRHDPSRYAVVYEEKEEVVCGPGWNFAPVSRAATGQMHGESDLRRQIREDKLAVMSQMEQAVMRQSGGHTNFSPIQHQQPQGKKRLGDCIKGWFGQRKAARKAQNDGRAVHWYT